MKSPIIKHAYNLAYYKPSIWELLLLAFVNLQTHDYDGVVITYKTFGNRLYIYSIRRETYAANKPTDGGVNTPWLN